MSGVALPDSGSKDSLQVVKTILMDPELRLRAEFLGQMKGGRWLVRLESQRDHQDMARLLLDRKICVAAYDPPSQFPPQKEKEEEKVKKVMAEGDVVRGPVVPRGVMPEGGMSAAGVCYLSETPFTMYVCPAEQILLYSRIRSQAQAASLLARVEPVLGTCCLVRHAGEFFRAEITNISADGRSVHLFLIDYGKTVTEDVARLKPLPGDLSTEPGLVIKVTLRGVKPKSDVWTAADRDACQLLLDAGGSSYYQVYDVNYIGDRCYVNMADKEGTDIASQMLETGAAAADNFVGNIFSLFVQLTILYRITAQSLCT